MRYNPHQLVMRFDVGEIVQPMSAEHGGAPGGYEARYNIAPAQAVPAVTLFFPHKGEEGAPIRVLEPLRWGLIPRWTQDPSKIANPINARAETVATSGMFKTPFKRHRCLLPSDGFYEWQAQGKGPKQPYFFRLKSNELYSFAGIMDEWLSPDGSPLRTCAHITTVPNALVEPIHDRMPVILHREDEAMWLDPEVPVEALVSLLVPYPAELMEAIPISRMVNNAREDDPRMIEPLED